MKIWLITVGEPLPTDPGLPRLLRAGLVAQLAAEQGYDVVWWTSRFDHQAKVFREPIADGRSSGLGYDLVMLQGCGYARNVSPARIRDHRQVARAFAAEAPKRALPDVILCSYPTIELCEAAIAYARPRRIPVVLDMRDLWPDIFVNLAPRWAQPLARLALGPMFAASRRACGGATAIVGITDAFVDWGVARAGRGRTPLDLAFPLAYEWSTPADAALASARSIWDSRGLHAGRPIACFFGTLGRQFDIPSLVQSAGLLADTPWQIVICGTGDRIDEYRRMGGRLPNLHFPGWVDAAAIRALMERSLVGLAPYHNEHSFTLSIPNKAIEYLAGGLPVVSTLRGELERMLDARGCGLTVQEGDARAIAETLRRLTAEPDMRRRMADNASAAYQSHFVARNVYGRLLAHLGVVAARP